MKVSVITTCFNAQSCISKTIESVLSQDYSDFEYIIMDGGSTDDTLMIAEKYKDSFNQKGIDYRIFSQKDSGIYDGMNNGVSNAVGEYVNFMNADDVFFDSKVLRQVFDSISASPDIIYGDACEFEYGRYYYFVKDYERITRRMPFSHQSVFAKRELLIKHPFNSKYKIAADYDFLMNCYDEDAIFFDSNVMICTVSKDGISSTDLYNTFLETEHMLNSHGVFRYSKMALKKKLLTLKIKQLGMNYLPSPLKLIIRRIQRKMRHQNQLVAQ